MNILWLTPFNVRSAIGVFSQEVCNELRARGHDVRIMRIETGPEADLPCLSGDFEILTAESGVPHDVDLIVINYGNHAPYHAGALRIAAEHPSLAIFHDAEMRHFEWGVMNRHSLSLPRLTSDTIPSISEDPPQDLVDPDSRPILEILSAMSVGAIVHGPHYLPTIAAACSGPVAVLPLCYPVTGTARVEDRSDRRLMVTIFGIISHYKQPERLMRAAAQLGEEGLDIVINLAGPIEDHYRNELTALAEELSIDVPVFHGYLSDDDLVTTLGQSDAICCLRYPVTEGGSASLITALYQGRPMIVPDIASYSMVPDDLVLKVSYGEEIEDLTAALRMVFDNPAEARRTAQKARDWAAATYSPSTYVDALVPILDQVILDLPIHKAMRQLSEKAVAPNGAPMTAALISMSRAAQELFFA